MKPTSRPYKAFNLLLIFFRYLFISWFIMSIFLISYYHHNTIQSSTSIDCQPEKSLSKFNEYQLQSISQLHDFCQILNSKTFQWNGVSKATSSAGFDIFVYKSNDFVSNTIRNGGSWEYIYIRDIIKLLSLLSLKRNVSKSDIIFLDIGVNIGSFSLFITYFGFETIGFEALIENSMLTRGSMCLNSDTIGKHFTLFNVGLGEKSSKCIMFSADHNFGNGQMKCNDTGPEIEPNMSVIGSITTARLDDYIDDANIIERIGLVKMDVEGFEPFIVKGGENVLLKSQIPFIMTELVPKVILERNGDPQQLFNRSSIMDTLQKRIHSSHRKYIRMLRKL